MDPFGVRRPRGRGHHVPREVLLLEELFRQIFGGRRIPFVSMSIITVTGVIHLLRMSHIISLQQWAFVPSSVVKNGEIYRIFSGELVHGDTYHWCCNMLSVLLFHCHMERRYGSLRHMEVIFWAIVMSKSIYLVLSMTIFSSSTWTTPVVGFSGVIFFMTMLDCTLFPHIPRRIHFPFLGEIAISARWYPWISLMVAELWHPRSATIGHLAGILAGMLFVGSTVMDYFLLSTDTLQSMERWESLQWCRQKQSFVETPSFRRRPMDLDIFARISTGLARILGFDLVRIVTTILFFPLQVMTLTNNRAEEHGRGPTEDERSGNDESPKEDTDVVDKGDGSSNEAHLANHQDEQGSNVVSPNSSAVSTSVVETAHDQESPDRDAFPAPERPIENSPSHSISHEQMVSIAESNLSNSDGRLPTNFTLALDRLLSCRHAKEDKKLLVDCIELIQKMVHNATSSSKGQNHAKYRSVKMDNPKIQSYSDIDGALDLLLSFGFEIKENFDDEQCLVYPKKALGKNVPVWHQEALQVLKDKAAVLRRSQLGDLRMKSLQAAEDRRASNVNAKSVRSNSQGGYTAGLGGGNAQNVFYRGGT